MYDSRMDPAAAEARLKSMTAWQVDPYLTQGDITTLLTASSRYDRNGVAITDLTWIPTYDLDWAACEGWTWKAGAVSNRYRISGDQSEMDRNQIFNHCERMISFYRKRMGVVNVRSPGGTLIDRTGMWSAVPWWWEVSA